MCDNSPDQETHYNILSQVQGFISDPAIQNEKPLFRLLQDLKNAQLYGAWTFSVFLV